MNETLTYRLYWGVIPVGTATATTAWVEEEGRRLIAIRTRARSNRVLRAIYPVDSRVESFVDPQTLLPVRFVKRLSEGRRRHHEVTTFDHAAGVARFQDLRKDRVKTFPIDPDTRDLLSFMYFARGQSYEPGSGSDYRVMADDKMYGLRIDALRNESVEDASGEKVEVVRLEPKATFEGLFVRKGRMFLWVSRQAPTVIVRADVEVPVARVKAILVPPGVEVADDD